MLIDLSAIRHFVRITFLGRAWASSTLTGPVQKNQFSSFWMAQLLMTSFLYNVQWTQCTRTSTFTKPSAWQHSLFCYWDYLTQSLPHTKRNNELVSPVWSSLMLTLIIVTPILYLTTYVSLFLLHIHTSIWNADLTECFFVFELAVGYLVSSLTHDNYSRPAISHTYGCTMSLTCSVQVSRSHNHTS